MRAFLEAKGLWNEQAEQNLRRECAEAVDAAVKQYLATPKQSTDAMFDYLYAQLPAALRTQREDARRYATLRP
jgi:2-oxoisovalerate dehydrogenase E1 component alpha subunit